MEGLSKLAVKRLQKELREPLPLGLSLAVVDDNLSTLHGNVLMTSGPYEGVVFHVLVEVGHDYPKKAPALFFRSYIAYMNGAQTHVNGKGESVCLDLLGNFGHIHTEWGSESSGWSPATTLAVVLLQLQGGLNDMLSHDRASVEKTRKEARELRCSCGHAPGNVFPALESAVAAPAPAAAAGEVDWKERCVQLEKEVAQLREKAAAYDALSEVFQRMGVASGAAVPVVPAVAAPPVGPSLTHLKCFVTGACAADEDEQDEIFGFGVGVSQNGTLSTAGELVSKSAFDGGVRRGSQNQAMDFFLPIYVSSKHWQRAKKTFQESVHTMFVSMGSKQRGGGPKGGSVEVEALLVLCSLMNSACLSVAEANQKAHDNFVNAYFALCRITRWLVASFPAVSKYADERIAYFMGGQRSKTHVPNLGEFLVLLHASKKNTWETIAEAFVEETDARNVRWFKNGALQSDRHVENRAGLTFAEAATSRKIISFQVRFLQRSAKADLSKFADLDVPQEWLKALKDIHTAVAKQQTWADYFKELDMASRTETVRIKELELAVDTSRKLGYHGGKKGGNCRR